ncbi:MAG TPA: hypothetical protein VLZ89_03470 [Anaerolineales bacterium]|nr:hypothetical protein [Anaerolineales bacterium]
MNTDDRPFWADEPDGPSPKLSARFPRFFKIWSVILLLLFAALPAYLLAWRSAYLGWAWLAFMILIHAFYFLQKRYRKNTVDNIDRIQEHAKEILGASQIGSAIQAAGHPLLQREQPVVPALVDDRLNIHPYENATPLDAVPLKNIRGVYTVVYDDDRVPQVEAIAGAAQALPPAFLWNEQPCTCLFRRMRKAKPTDWHQAIQQVRLQAGLAK